MCTQCVAGSVPYIAVVLGGLQAMRWKARRGRAGSEAVGDALGDAVVPSPAAGAEGGRRSDREVLVP